MNVTMEVGMGTAPTVVGGKEVGTNRDDDRVQGRLPSI